MLYYRRFANPYQPLQLSGCINVVALQNDKYNDMLILQLKLKTAQRINRLNKIPDTRSRQHLEEQKQQTPATRPETSQQ
jgi:hypothetical protein